MQNNIPLHKFVSLQNGFLLYKIISRKNIKESWIVIPVGPAYFSLLALIIIICCKSFQSAGIFFTCNFLPSNFELRISIFRSMEFGLLDFYCMLQLSRWLSSLQWWKQVCSYIYNFPNQFTVKYIYSACELAHYWDTPLALWVIKHKFFTSYIVIIVIWFKNVFFANYLIKN